MLVAYVSFFRQEITLFFGVWQRLGKATQTTDAIVELSFQFAFMYVTMAICALVQLKQIVT